MAGNTNAQTAASAVRPAAGSQTAGERSDLTSCQPPTRGGSREQQERQDGEHPDDDRRRGEHHEQQALTERRLPRRGLRNPRGPAATDRQRGPGPVAAQRGHGRQQQEKQEGRSPHHHHAQPAVTRPSVHLERGDGERHAEGNQGEPIPQRPPPPDEQTEPDEADDDGRRQPVMPGRRVGHVHDGAHAGGQQHQHPGNGDRPRQPRQHHPDLPDHVAQTRHTQTRRESRPRWRARPAAPDRSGDALSATLEGHRHGADRARVERVVATAAPCGGLR